MLLALVLMPALAGGLAFLIRCNTWRRRLLVLVAAAHAVFAAIAWFRSPAPMFAGWLALDAQGLLMLSVTSFLFLMSACYAAGYLKREARGPHTDMEEGGLFSNAPETVFIACLLFFLATMTLVTCSRHLGLLWVAIEASTLASAPLIYFHRHHRSLEATWKYLMVCSVGVALALLGNFLLAIAALDGRFSEAMLLDRLLPHAASFQVSWLKAAFIFILVGYGTKMGLAPLHTWLPDAHSESPSLVSALLSGALLNCAFLGILRVYSICVAAGQAAFAQDLLIALGLISMAFAAIFIIGQSDYKRMLAYSSVEHMGILALGVGLGGAATFGSMLHLVNHSLTKALLFLVAGNILACYQTKSTASVRGVLRTLPVSGILWLAGFFAITGSPPFGMFLSEFTILRAALDQGHLFISIAYLVLLALIFIGMTSIVLRMAQGKPDMVLISAPVSRGEAFSSIAPPAILCICVLGLGLYVPAPLGDLLQGAAHLLGGN